MLHSVDTVIEHFGGVSKFARELGCTSQAVSQMKRVGAFSEGRAYQIQVLSKGRFKTSALPIRKRGAAEQSVSAS